MVGAASSLERDGYCTLIGALHARQIAALRAEARERSSTARRVAGDYYRVNGDRSVSSPRKLATAEAGPVLEAIHRDSARLGLLRRPAGGDVSPTLCASSTTRPGTTSGSTKTATGAS